MGRDATPTYATLENGTMTLLAKGGQCTCDTSISKGSVISGVTCCKTGLDGIRVWPFKGVGAIGCMAVVTGRVSCTSQLTLISWASTRLYC